MTVYYIATAQLLTGSSTALINGVSGTFSVDTTVPFTATGQGTTADTASARAIRNCNIKAFAILEAELALFTAKQSTALAANVYAPNYSTFVQSAITKVEPTCGGPCGP
jgi:hypothetical protein